MSTVSNCSKEVKNKKSEREICKKENIKYLLTAKLALLISYCYYYILFISDLLLSTNTWYECLWGGLYLKKVVQSLGNSICKYHLYCIQGQYDQQISPLRSHFWIHIYNTDNTQMFTTVDKGNLLAIIIISQFKKNTWQH